MQFSNNPKWRGRRSINKLCKETVKSIVYIAWKHDLDPELLVESLVKAWKRNVWRTEIFNCGSLEIHCRKIVPDTAYFLITKEGKVIAQFPIKIKLLRNPVSLTSRIQYIPKTTYIISKIKNKIENRLRKISELRSGMKKVNLKAKIVEIPLTKYVMSRWGNLCQLSNIEIADETGTITLNLWNKRVNNKFKVGDEIEIKHCYVHHFRSELQVRLTRKSIIIVKSTEKELKQLEEEIKIA